MIVDLETPTSLFLKLAPLKPAFLLESVVQGEQLGRYSFIGIDPIRRVDYTGGGLEGLLARELGPSRTLPDPGARLCHGLVGAVSYEAVHELLPTGRAARSKEGVPLASFIVPRAVIVFDHVKQRLNVSSADGEAGAQAVLREVKALVAAPIPLPKGRGAFGAAKASVAEPDFHRMVERARDHIAAGDIFQVVLSLAFEGETDLDPFQVYRALRHLNPSPYLYFLDFGETQMIGSSPEALVRLDGDDMMIRPIAGTRPRGATDGADAALANELLADPKENAEHNMLVDLARNDVGRVAEPGSVTLPELRVIERYSHVMHIVSTVKGRLARGKSAFDVFRAAFPAGTVSGAPKIRALQIIDDLETSPRGFYAGSVGYFSASGDMDQAIAIRTIVLSQGRYSAQAGAGIVADSRPEKEYQEIRNKAAALLAALELASGELKGSS